MIMSNFISEAERHEELYSVYSARHQEILSIFTKIKDHFIYDEEIVRKLVANKVNCAEIEWLKRTGHYLPVYNSY